MQTPDAIALVSFFALLWITASIARHLRRGHFAPPVVAQDLEIAVVSADSLPGANEYYSTDAPASAARL